jgi:hypothetical protein
MCVPTSEISYTSATTRRETTKSMMEHVVALDKEEEERINYCKTYLL